MTGCFNGLITAMITPFTKNGVNFEEFGKMIDRQIENGADGLVILGTTGEPSTMSEEEKEEVVKFVVARAKKLIKIIVGTGSNDTKKAVSFSKKAEKLGVDGVIAVTPYYNKCTQEGIYLYYKAICEAVKLPVIAYNVPARTGVNILPETAEKLSNLPNMAGIKEACDNMAQIVETQRRIRGKMDLFSGDDFLNLPIIAIGGAGMISVVSNVAPTLTKKLFTYMKEQNLEKANEINDLLIPLVRACFLEVNPIPTKSAYNLLGFDVGIPRPPLTELTEKNKLVLKNEMEKLGLL